ncbi:MAG TPA: membrane protein insertase YidC [Deltaproteobacteria bacterium]|nr:membrane protein insertase YidC [Deltaproteobacteria bacterium]
MDEKQRTTLALALTAIILIVWFVVFDQTRQPKEPAATEQKTAQAQHSLPAREAKPISVAPVQATPAVQAPGSSIVVDTPLYRATFTTTGGCLTSFRLKKYLTTMKADAQAEELLTAPMPTLMLGAGATDAGLAYEASRQGRFSLDRSEAIEFRAEAAPGVTVRKIYSLDPNTYLLGYRTVVENHTASPMAAPTAVVFGSTYPLGKKLEGYAFQGPVLLNGKHLEEFKLDKVKKPDSFREFTGAVQWFGYEDKYFLQAIINMDAPETTLMVKRASERTVELHYKTAPASIQPGAALSRDSLIFLGPKEIKTLKSAGHNLFKALDFGFFDIIAKPLLISMNWIYRYAGSYGWTIIILTVIIKILLYPLTLKSFTSMKELQKIQPLMKEIQQQYKDDKQKMNQELMRLYQEHKINPMGGCLPMLLQIPILFALYKVFYQAIELRHTPFHIVGTWLPDLSAADPYWITPILMGATQFVMQKMTPTTGDPMQQKVMLIMPVVFTALFINFPSGLVIYWLVSNILSIVQQAYINRKHA